MSSPNPEAVLASLANHPHRDPLAAQVRRAAFEAAASRQRDFIAVRSSTPDAEPPAEADSAPEQSLTELGDVALILRDGTDQPEQHALISTLLALGVRQDVSRTPENNRELCSTLVWLATNTPVDALSALDAVLGPQASPLWPAIGDLATDPRSVGGDLGRPEALVAAAALRASPADSAGRALEQVRTRATDPLVLKVLSGAEEELTPRLRGELHPAPRSTWRLVLLAVTGLLFVVHFLRLLARYMLGLRRPAEVRLDSRGLQLRYRTELLGRVLTDREIIVPRANLARVTREVRYARVGLYAGLAALAIGTYFGMGFLVDGARVPGGSPPLLALGLLIVLAGLAIDFGLSTLAGTLRGKCRLVVVPRKGRPLCVASLRAREADDMLLAIADDQLTQAPPADAPPSAPPEAPASPEAPAQASATS